MFLKSITVIGTVLIFVGCGGDTPKIESSNSVVNTPTPKPTIDTTELNSELTQTQQNIIQEHNKKREIYFTDAPLTYSLKLENEAQIYANILANSGEFEHDTENNHKKNYGENLYASSKNRPLTIYDAMPNWFEKEEPHYHYEDGSCDIGFQCGHYTQVIWQNTKEVGCATAKYKRGNFKNGYVYVCKYYKAGNIYFNQEAQKPYCFYDTSDIYLNNTPSNLSLAGKKFSIELIVEDRVNCTRDNIDNSVIEFSSDLKSATIPDFQIFNNGKYANSLEFDNISIDNNIITLIGINKNISDSEYKDKIIYMKIEILGESEDYYSANIEWNGLDRDLPEYSRTMKAKLYK